MTLFRSYVSGALRDARAGIESRRLLGLAALLALIASLLQQALM